LERIGLRPEKAIELNWMLPAPAQGAILVVGRENDEEINELQEILNDQSAALRTKIERDFLQALYGGCSTPISAAATIQENHVYLHGNVLSPDGRKKAEIKKDCLIEKAANLGLIAGSELLKNGGKEIVEELKLTAK